MIIVIDTPDAIRAATEYSEYMRGHDIVILMRYNKKRRADKRAACQCG